MGRHRTVTASGGATWVPELASYCSAATAIDLIARCSDPGELRARLVLDRPDVVVLDSGDEWLDAVLIDSIRTVGAGIVVVGDPGDPRPARLGCGTAVDPSRPDLVAAAVVAATVPVARGGSGTGRRGGSVVAVWGPKGGTGRTTVAVNLAWEIASAGTECVLVDADTTGGNVALALGLADQPSVAALAHAAGRGRAAPGWLDPYPRPLPRLTVVPGPARAAEWPEVRDADLVVMLAAMRRAVPVVVVDVGACLEDDDELLAQQWPWRRHQAARAAIRTSDAVVATVACDPASIRHAVDAGDDLCTLVDASRVVVLVNKVEARRSAAVAALELERRCGWYGGSHLAPLDAAASVAAWGGKALAEVAPSSPLRLCVRELARDLVVRFGSERRRRRGAVIARA